jgi:hypothetical protein
MLLRESYTEPGLELDATVGRDEVPTEARVPVFLQQSADLREHLLRNSLLRVEFRGGAFCLRYAFFQRLYSLQPNARHLPFAYCRCGVHFHQQTPKFHFLDYVLPLGSPF